MSKETHDYVKWVLVYGTSFPLMHVLSQKGVVGGSGGFFPGLC